MENTPAIIFEDNHIIVVIKPQGMPSQPDASGDLDMLTMLKQYRTENENKPGEAFLGLVHRLDRVTGGVMVFAKTSKSAKRLSLQIQAGSDGHPEYGTFSKKYLAIIHGTPKQPQGRLEHYLLKDDKLNKVAVVGAATSGAKRAELTYKVMHSINIEHIGRPKVAPTQDIDKKSYTDEILSPFESQNKSENKAENLSLVQINLLTGRSHQIRIQFATIGNPLVNDHKYNSSLFRVGFALGEPLDKNLCLWSYQLSFNHPTSGELLKFIVNPPETHPWEMFDFARKDHKTQALS